LPAPAPPSITPRPPTPAPSRHSGWWRRANERSADWWDRKRKRNFLIFTLIVLISTLIGTAADLFGLNPLRPCSLRSKGDQAIHDSYGIAVPNVAVRLARHARLSDQAEKYAREINDSLYNYVKALGDVPNVGVSRTCDHGIFTGARRWDYLSKTRNELNADIAISLTLIPSGQLFVAEIEMDIGSRARWNEAQELAGHFSFPGGLVGASLDLQGRLSQSSVAELLTPYISMLRAVADYARSDYSSVLSTLQNVVAVPKLPPALMQLAFVLSGNSDGRLAKPDALRSAAAQYKSAAAQYRKALTVPHGLPSIYMRATLGLAEIDYQRGLSQLKRNAKRPRCDGTLTKSASASFEAADKKYMSVYRQATASSVSGLDVRAKFGMGRIHECKFLLGAEKPATAISYFSYATSKFLSDPDHDKSWLRSPASGAFGELALIDCVERRRDQAIQNYDLAIRWVVDDERAEEYQDNRAAILSDGKACR